jgi:hypothetical protein
LRHNKIFRIAIVIICSLILSFQLSGCGDDIAPSKYISRENIIKQYKDNAERFRRVAEYLKNDKADIYIDKTDKRKFSVKKSGKEGLDTKEIDNGQINKDIEYILYNLGFKRIDEYGTNGVFFSRQTSMRYDAGIVYSKDGEEPDWGTIEELEAIEDNWYWYKGY